MGRLFDAMSALLSVCSRRGYEGQPAILLEAAAMEAPEANTLPGYPVPLTAIGDMAVIDGARILFEAWTDFRGGSPVSQVAARFHATIAEATAAVATLIAREQKIEFVSLSGGCFQNVLLTGRTSRLLRSNGLTPVVHRLLPPSDEAVSYGQVIMAGVERQRDDSV
jgi:hydrogenase maturation protein HypF